MALDSTGRPIPVHTPDPPNHESRATAEQEQFLLVARKSDEALRQVADLASRVAALEQAVEQPLNTTLDELRRRFDEMMLARMTDHETRFQALAEAVRRATEPAPGPAPALPHPSE
jgi:hypothetical protein